MPTGGVPDAVASCGHMCYVDPVANSVSIRELRNHISEVVRRVETGERVTVTVDRRPVAELVPLRRGKRVTIAEALAVVTANAADRGLLADLRAALPDTTDDL